MSAVSVLKNKLGSELLQLAGDSVFLLFCRISGAVLVLVTQVLLARWMGTQELGIYVYAFSWIVFLSLLAGLGLPSAAVRFIGQGRAQDRGGLVVGYFRRSVQVTMLLSFVLVGVVLLASQWVSLGPDPMVTIFACMLLPVLALIHAYVGTALAMSWLKTAFLLNVVFRPTLFLVLIAMVWLYTNGLSSAIAMLVQAVAALVTLVWLATLVHSRLRAAYGGEHPESNLPTWIRTASPLLIIVLFVEYFQDMNIVFVGFFLEADDLAVYNVTIRLAFLIGFGIHAITTTIMPKTAMLHASEDQDALQRVTTNASRLQFAWAVTATVGLLVLGKFLLSVFGESFVPGYLALLLLALAQVVVAAFGPVAQLLNITGHQDQCMTVYVFSAAVLFALTSLLTPLYGINGAAGAVLLTFLLQSVTLYFLAVRRTGVYASILGRL